MLPPGHSFGLVALDGPALEAGVPAELHLEPARSALRDLPPETEAWEDTLGPLVMDRLSRSGLTFLATEPDLGPGRDLALGEARGLFRCLQLVAFVRLDSPPLVVGGRSRKGGPVPETVGELPRPVVPPGVVAPPVGWVELGLALRLREGLRAVERELRSGPVSRALGTFAHGLTLGRAEDRVGAFVQVIETLVAPLDAGGAGKAFRKRTRLFVGRGHEGTLGRLYAVARRAGHGRVARERYDEPEPLGVRVGLVHDAVTAEILARSVLQRVVLTPALREHFLAEEAVERFWSGALDDVERGRLWGQPLSVDEARQAFRPGALRPAGADTEV